VKETSETNNCRAVIAYKYLFGQGRIVYGPSQHHRADKTGVYGERSFASCNSGVSGSSSCQQLDKGSKTLGDRVTDRRTLTCQLGAVASGSSAFRVRVWQITSGGRGPRTRRTRPEGVDVGYSRERDHLCLRRRGTPPRLSQTLP